MDPVQLPEWCRLVLAANPGPMTLDGTNTYILSTEAGNVVVDPGPLIEDHLCAVSELGPVLFTVLTHHHLDHTEGAQWFHEITGAPVLARDPSLCVAGGPLTADGAVLDAPGLELRVLHTPGHTADSICIQVGREGWRGLLSGDTVLGRGTTVVAHPDGELAAYLNSLEKLRAQIGPDDVLLPAHGPVRPDAAAVVQEYIDHRHARLEEVRAALAAGASSARDVVQIVYADVDHSLWPAAERTVAAALDYLDARQ